MKIKHKKEKGQASIEFALMIMVAVFFSFFFLQLCFFLGFSSYVQYATFMSARAFLSAGPTTDDQRDRADMVLRQMIKWMTP